jgi:hypothetical protein
VPPRIGYAAGRAGAGLAWAAAVIVVTVAAVTSSTAGVFAAFAAGAWRGIVVLLCCYVAAIVIHELGHLCAARLLGVPVTGVYLGGPPALVTVRLGGVRLGLGLLPRGRVTHRVPPSAGRRALIIAAGPLANLVTAALALPLPLPRWVSWPIALTWAGLGLASLIPRRPEGERLSDGSVLMTIPGQRRAAVDLRRLLATPGWTERPDATDRLLTAFWRQVPEARHRFAPLAVLLKRNGRIDDLLKLHAVDFRLADSPDGCTVTAIHVLEWMVVTLPRLGRPVIDLAARRLEWAADHASPRSRAAIEHSLAVARIRQGRLAEVEELCAGTLAAEMPARERATVLATVAMARHLLGQDSQQPMAEALALDPAAELVSEARQVLSRPPLGTQTPTPA